MADKKNRSLLSNASVFGDHFDDPFDDPLSDQKKVGPLKSDQGFLTINNN
jgi:hypothetical protein